MTNAAETARRRSGPFVLAAAVAIGLVTVGICREEMGEVRDDDVPGGPTMRRAMGAFQQIRGSWSPTG